MFIMNNDVKVYMKKKLLFLFTFILLTVVFVPEVSAVYFAPGTQHFKPCGSPLFVNLRSNWQRAKLTADKAYYYAPTSGNGNYYYADQLIAYRTQSIKNSVRNKYRLNQTPFYMYVKAKFALNGRQMVVDYAAICDKQGRVIVCCTKPVKQQVLDGSVDRIVFSAIAD